MGGKKKNKTKKKKTKVQEAAAKRHETFKKTGVQTFGGTKKRYSKAEARKIEKAGLSFSKVTGGAANPLNRAPTTEDIKVGPMKKEFTSPLGGMSYSQFAGAMKSNPFGPSPAGADRGVSFSDAMRATRGGSVGLGISRPSTGGIGGTINRRLETPKDYVPQDVATLGGFGINKKFQDKTHYNDDGSLKKSTSESRIDRLVLPDNEFKEKYGITTEQHDNLQSRTLSGGGDLIAASNVGGLTGLVNQGVPSVGTRFTPTIGGLAESLGLDPNTGREVGTTAGGLNIGGLSAEESDRLGRVFRAGPSPKMFSEGGDLRFSDMFEAAGPGANLTKGINFVKNKIPLVKRIPDMKINSVAEEAQRQYLGYNPNLPASALARMDRRGGGGARLPLAPTIAQEVAPQYQPVPSASTTPTTQTGVDPNRLLQIQQQAYAQAFNPMVVGGYNPTFRFGASSPTIDYSSYFNY